MKKLLVAITFVSCAVHVHAQQNDVATEINRLEQACVQAILNQDTATLKKLWAQDFMVNAPINKVVTGGQVKMVAAGIIKYSSFVLENEQTMVQEDLVITMGHETVVTLGSNYPVAGKTVHRRYTQVWQKQHGNWILIARQASDICE
jgi:hypothetical protein